MVRLRIAIILASGAFADTPPPEQAAWSILDKALSAPKADHRRQALVATGTIESIEAMKLVAAGLQDKDPPVRQTAAAVLGQMKLPEAVPYLKAALNDCDEVAFVAAKSLAEIGDESGRKVFQDVLTGERKDAPGMLTSKMRDAKKTMHNPAKLALMGIKEAAGFLGPAAMGIDMAEDALKDRGATGRAVAAGFLADDPDPYALTLLEWALADDNQAVRAAAAQALGKRGNRDSISKLQPLLADSHNLVRTMAAASIVRLSNGKPVLVSSQPVKSQ